MLITLSWTVRGGRVLWQARDKLWKLSRGPWTARGGGQKDGIVWCRPCSVADSEYSEMDHKRCHLQMHLRGGVEPDGKAGSLEK